VNRYWSFFFSGRGIVDPVDDMRATNPPSNPELLDALAADFVEHRFDLKHLVYTICTSHTYQLSSLPNAYNKSDMQNFSRHNPQRLQAEVLLDAIDLAIGGETKFEIRTPKLPTAEEREAFRQQFPFERALDLPVEDLVSPSFLTMFGKPLRDTASACERSSEATLDQSLYLLNSQEMQNKLSSDTSRAAKLAADPGEDSQKIKDLYLLFYARPPNDDESRDLLAFLSHKSATTESRRQAFEDILWALLNSKEFLFNH
jgi:hypothetical protein